MLPLPPDDVEEMELVQKGGFGVVYRGRSQTLGMTVALKVIQGSYIKDLMKELRKESNIMLKASHPYVLHLLGVYEKREGDLIKPCLVMEYMPHGSLCMFLSSQPDVPCALRFRILHQVVLGMKYLHSLQPPIIHRDLKPANVLLNAYLDVKITDFGLSNILGSSSSRHGSCAGTLAYMPPEAITDLNYKPTKAYDVYSFGILMWSVFTGENPYENAPNHLIVLKVPEMQRPDETALNRWDGVKTMPEAKQLMRRCWDGDAECRPSFHDCSKVTSRLVKQYEGEMDSTVEQCRKHLRRPPPSTKVDSDVSLRVSDFQHRYNQPRTPTLLDEESGALNTSDDLSTFNENTEYAVGVFKDFMKVSGKLGNDIKKLHTSITSEEDLKSERTDQALQEFAVNVKGTVTELFETPFMEDVRNMLE